VNVYVESSAVLAWLLGEESAASIRRVLDRADIVMASDLTLIECDRVLIRAATLGELSEADAAGRRGHLTAAAAYWQVLRISPDIVERARLPFPGEPIRTLDALAARSAVPGLALLSLDARIRGAGTRLGLQVQPT
jgi:hypothetical protein